MLVAPVLAETKDEWTTLEQTLQTEVRRHPESRESRLSLAKLLHFRGVDGDANAANQSRELLERLASERGDDPIVLVYLGSSRLVAARLAWNPWRKRTLVREGLDLMDRSVARASEDPEVRFLRGASTRPLPRYFGRSELSSQDLSEAASRAKAAYSSGHLDKDLAGRSSISTASRCSITTTGTGRSRPGAPRSRSHRPRKRAGRPRVGSPPLADTENPR